MSVHGHRAGAGGVSVAVLTISDTRTDETDDGGRTLRELLTAAGHEVVHHAILKDEPADVRREVERLVAGGTVRAVVTTGGTGISARDSTIEALEPLLEKRLDGFGELFRMLSYEQVGAAAMMSRALAGTVRGVVVVALPGSVDAVRLAVDKLLAPELGHMAKVAERVAGKAR